MKLFYKAFVFTCLQFTLFICNAQTADSTYAQRLGYLKNARVVILHVDDAGMSFDSNEGVIMAMTKGIANSCSVMMPCSWVPGFVHYLKAHPGIDAGLHLTLTSEWDEYRWGPVAGKAAVPGLVDKEGNLWPGVPEVVSHATAAEVDKEIHAQLDKARTMGFEPTHLDSHMGTLFATPGFMQAYIKLGIENKIPVMLPAGHATLISVQSNLPAATMMQIRALGKMLWNAGLPVLDDLHNSSYDWKIPDSIASVDDKLRAFKTGKYIESLKGIKPGITMIIMHCTATSEVFKHISDSGPVRKGDLLAMMDPALKTAMQKQGFIFTTWRELKERRDRVK